MDITNNKEKLYSTKLINTETVNYTATTALSLIVFFAIKQLLKTFFDVKASIAVLVAFIIVTVLSYFLEKKLVFHRGISSGVKQVLMLIFRCAVDFAFYKICDFVFGNILTRQSSFVFAAAITIIFFFNYYFDRLLIFECLDNASNKHQGRFYKLFFRNRFVLFSMFIAFICICFVYIIYSTFPFGDMTVMRMDLYHQYGPLFAELYDRVIEGKSFFYSWQSGGGSSFLGNYFNYLSSPLTIIIFFFDKKNISFAITALVAVKCILSAGAFSFYIKKSQKRHSMVSAAFGVLYAFSAYFLAYYWNVMWLDSMIIMPFIALGIENIINKRSAKLYIVSLALLLFANYYMGFMCCIFSVIYFLAYFSITKKYNEKVNVNAVFTKKDTIKSFYNNMFVNRLMQFITSSVIVGCICACTLIPIYLILRSCSATSDTFPDTFTSYFSIFDFLTSHLAGLETTIRSSGDDVLPNVYCGILTIVLIPLYVINKDIRIKEKAVYLITLLFFLFSFDNNVMNFMWHAFHFPNDLPYRFSYMYIFLLLVIAFRALMHIKSITAKDAAFCGMGWLLYIIIAQKFMTSKMDELTIYSSIAFVIIWTGIIMIIKSKKISTFALSVTIVALTFSEVAICDTKNIIFAQNNSDYVTNYENYTDAVNYIKDNDKGLYKTELCYLNTRMDPCYYNYDGMSTFSSMAYESYSGLQYSLGMFGNRINSYTYNTQTPVYNMMFGIKYLIYSNSMNVSTPSTQFYTLRHTTDADSENKTAQIYSNDYYMPIAYGISENIDNWVTDEGDPFVLQKDYFALATGLSDVFIPCDYTDCSFDNLDGDSLNDNGTFWFSKSDDTQYGYIDVDITAHKDGELYIYITSPDVKSVEYQYEDGTSSTQSIEEPYIIDLGYRKAGETVSVEIDGGAIETEDSSVSMYAYTLDKDVFVKGYNKLLENSLNVTSHSDTKIEGKINLNEQSYLYTSIPYDDGWSIYVDGQKAEIFETGDCLLSTEISAGEHSVKLVYTPKGIKYGVAISGTTVIALAGYCIIKHRKAKKNCYK